MPFAVAVIIAIVGGILFISIGVRVLAALSRPAPEPPPPGELRKVRIVYECTICGTQVRMTLANDEMPDAPRHCQEDMRLISSVDD